MASSDVSPRMSIPPRWRIVLWVIAALLLLRTVQMLGGGLLLPWTEATDIDLQLRGDEFEVFRQGVYPNANLIAPPEPWLAQYTVYPPYAFPMMAPLFEPGGLNQARLLLTALSLAALALIAVRAWRTLRPWGAAAAAATALVGLAMTGNKFSFALGQFSLLCMGLIFLQISLVERGRPWAAGMCWAFAMLKPQIALPFGVLFLLRGQGRGLLAGLAILAALSWAGCAWTGVDLRQVLRFWFFGMSFEFAGDGFGSMGPGQLAEQFGLDHRFVQFLLAGAMLGLGILAFLLVRRLDTPAVLPLAGFLGGMGMIVFYHRLYDVMMVFPAILATIAVAASRRNRTALAIAVVATLAVLAPNRRLLPGAFTHEAVYAAIWAAVAIVPLGALLVERSRKVATT
jgi:hypothetical protein